MESNKKILVTGAGGFVGKNLIKFLQGEGCQVRAMVRDNSDTFFLERLGVEVVKANMAIKKTLEPAVEGVDAIVHLATTMRGPWTEYKKSTIEGTRSLLELAKAKNVKRFVFISSISVYETSGSKGRPISEKSPLAQKDVSFYEKSKIEAEKAVLEYAKSGISCAILRPGVVYGPEGILYPSRLGYSLGDNTFLVIGSGNNQIPFVYVDSLIAAIESALEEKGSGEVYNVVDDPSLTQNRYLEGIKTNINPSLRIIRVPYFVMSIFAGVLGFVLKGIGKQSPFREKYISLCNEQIFYSNEKAKKELHWSSSHDADKSVEETMNAMKTKKQNRRCIDWKSLKKSCDLKNPVNVGIIGCGIIAQTHLNILKKIGNVHVAALCDVNMDAAHKLAESLDNVNIYNDVEEMLASEKLNVVHLLIPPQMRKEIVRKVTAHKCHVLIEKPMALDAAEAREMMAMAEQNGVQICVDHNHLYDPPMIEARKLISSGAAGEILHVESWYGFNLGANPNSRYMIPGAEKHWGMTMPGKLYQNLFSHPYSVLVDILGYPDKIHALTVSGNVVKTLDSDELKVVVTCNKKVGTITVSLAVNPRYQFLNIYGTKMSLFVDFLNQTLVRHATPKILPKAISRALIYVSTARIMFWSTVVNFVKLITKRFTYYDGTEILVKDFYRCLEEGRPMPVSAEDGLKSMEAMDEVWRQIGYTKEQ